MLAASRKHFNPNDTSTDATAWDKGDLSSFLSGVDIESRSLLNNDAKVSNKSLDYFQTAPKRELVAEIIRVINYNALKTLSGLSNVQKLNDRLLYQTKERNKSLDKMTAQLTKKIKYLEARMNSISLSLIKAKVTQSSPEFNINQIRTTENISSINEDSNQLVIEENLNINTIHAQTLFANPRLLNTLKKVNESININKKNNSITKIIVKPPSADLAVSDLNKNKFELSFSSNNPSINTSHDKQITHTQSIEPIINKSTKTKKLSLKKQTKFNKKKKKKNKNKINTTKNKSKNINTHHKRQQKQPKSVVTPQIIQAKLSEKNHEILSNDCTSMTLPYAANPNKQKRNKGINIIRKDIDIKMRYGIYRTSKCLEKQLQDILPYEEYKKNEQQAYYELNEKINYAVYNR